MAASPVVRPSVPPAAPPAAPPSLLRPLVAGALALAAVGALAWVVTGQLILPGVEVAGVPVGGLIVEDARKRLEPVLQDALSRPVILHADQVAQRFVPVRVGLELDLPATVSAAYAPGHRGGLGQRLGEWWGAGRRHLRVQAALRWNKQRYVAWTDGLRADCAVPAVDARWQVLPDGQIEVVPSSEGRDLVEAKLRADVQRAALAPAERRQVRLPLATAQPGRTTEAALFLGIHQVESRFRTNFSPRDGNRTENVRLAAAAVDQVVLQPGEVFSFNREVGPRVPESGYREAPVVVNGKLVPGVGGGVCQVSSTLYNAVLLADLSIVTRHRHSIPSAYVPPGRDATVAYDFFDFRFRNNRDWPVVVTTEIGQGWIEARLLGRQKPWDRVELKSEILETYPPQVEEIPDPTLPAGQRQLRSKGAPGYRVKVWKILYQNGLEVSRRLVSDDRYQPLHGLLRVGTGVGTGMAATQPAPAHVQPPLPVAGPASP